MQKILDLDARLSSRMRVAERPGLLRMGAILLAHSGDSWFWLVGLGLLWLFGTEYWRTRAIVMAVGILVTAVVVMAATSLPASGSVEAIPARQVPLQTGGR